MSIKAITKDTNGRIVSWQEDDYSFRVVRDSTTGKPLTVRGTSAGRPGVSAEFQYSVTDGSFKGLVGDVSSALAAALALEATDAWVQSGVALVLNNGQPFADLAAVEAAYLGASNPRATSFVGPSWSAATPIDVVAGVWTERGAAASVVAISTNTTLTAVHNGKVLRCSDAVTLEYPEGLGAEFSCLVESPSSGNVTIDPTGACTVNGGTASLTRSLANNPAGFVIRALGANVAGVSGS